jgi:cell division septation protein DedD
MNEVTRYRLIGSVFLLAMAAIFLPMIFDSPGPSLQEIAAETTPRDSVADAGQTGSLDAIDPSDEVDEMIAEMQQQQATLNQAFDDSDMQSQIQQMRDQVDSDGYWIENGTRFGEPILRPIRSDTKTFAVQLATFDDQSNARKLREQVRQNGDEAFISQYKQRSLGSEKVRYRVAVGPMLSHTLAKEKRASYSQEYGVEAIVVAMSQ